MQLLATALVVAVAATVVLQGAAACTLQQRNTINPSNGLPYCVKIALLKTGVSANPFYTNTLPKRVLENALLEVSTDVVVDVNQTDLIWEQGITAVQNGEYDVFVANIWILRRRVRLIDFSAPFTGESLGLLYLKPDGDTSALFSFLDPLHWTLWLGVLITFLLGAVALTLSELAHPSSAKEGGNPLADRRDIVGSFKHCCFHIINVPFGTMEHPAVSAHGKLISWTVSFFFLIILATYTANLASFLTVTQAQSVVSKDTLLASPVLAGPGDSAPFVEALGGSVFNGGFGDLSGDGLRNNPNVKSIVLSENNLRTITYTDCTTQWLRLDIPIDSALVFRQHNAVTQFKRKIDEAILQMKETGVLDRWNAAGLPKSECSEAGDLETNAMQFKHLRGVFLLSGIIIGAMLVWALARFIYDQRVHPQAVSATPVAVTAYTDETKLP